MHDGVHLPAGDDLADQGVANVGTKEADVAKIVPGWRQIDPTTVY